MACKDDGFCGFVGMQVVCEIFSIRSPTKLTHDVIFKELSTLKNIEKQLAYLFSLFDEVEVLHHNINICAIEKSNVVSNLLRQKGNIYYKNGDIKIALEYYSMSLSFAPEGSTEMAMAIGNKSACYFDLDHPWAVCSHIGIVEPMEMYPEKSWNKLKQRLKNVLTNFIPQYVPERIRQVCLYNYFNVTRWEWERSSSIISQPVLDFAGMSSETFTRVAAQLAQGVNPKVPGLSAAVKIEYNETLGRHLVAAKEIKPGDLVMRSNTSAPYLYAEKYEFSHCHYCLRFGHALVPCMDCPHERYCDMRCAELALNSYHWALCPVGGALNFGTHGAHAKLMLAIRLVVTHLSRHRGKMDEFLKEISKYDIERAENKIKGFNKKGVFDECDFRSVYYMWSDPSLLPEEERQSLLVDCAYAMQVITERSDLLLHEPSMVKSKKNEIRKELTSLLYHIRVGLEWNCFEMFDHLNYVSRKRTDKDKPFVVKSQVRSIGVYFNSLLGLFNHACYSNCVYSEQMNCITLVRALKKINVGEQLTIPYLDYWGTPKERRAALYRRMGGFQCGCFACSHDLDSKRVVKLRDLHLSPRCDRCKERKSARPDQDVVNCGKCKTTFSVDSVRSTLLRHIVMMHYYRVNLPIAEFPTMTAMFAFVEMIEEMALPHSCHELNRLRRAILNQIVAGDKCYVRPVMVCEPKRGLSLREELAAVPAHVWEDC